MRKLNITWITGDYFLDSDMQIVPVLKKTFNIKWIIVKSKDAKIDVSLAEDSGEIISMRHKSLSPLSMCSYYNLIKRIKASHPDILYLDYLGMPYFFHMLTKTFNMGRVVFMAHNVAPRPTWNWQYKHYYPYIFRHIKYIHIPTTHNISYIKEHYPDIQYFHVPMMVKSFGESEVTRNEEKTVGNVRFLFFGHVMNNKRLDLLLMAYKKLSAKDKENAELYVYGKCNEPEKFEMLAAGERNIHFHFGYVPNEMIPDLFTTASYLVLPYDNVDQSGPSMIALNYNLPIICSDLDGFKQIVNDNEDGFLYKKNDIQSLTDTLHKCINLDQDAYNMIKSSQAKFVKQHFSLDAVTEKYIQMFNNIAGKNI